MESRKRHPTEIHWDYYLALEEDFLKSARYVELSEQHLDVHSQFFTQSLISAASEFESVCKATANELEIEGVGNIAAIKKMLVPIMSSVESCSLWLMRGDLSVRPFAGWDQESQKIGWWDAYNDLKHLRHKKLERGSMRNALYALGGLYIANLVLANSTNQYDRLRSNELFQIRKMAGDSHDLFRGNYFQRGCLSLNRGEDKQGTTD